MGRKKAIHLMAHTHTIEKIKNKKLNTRIKLK